MGHFKSVDLERFYCTCLTMNGDTDLLTLFVRCAAMRHVGSTCLNEASSRSHAIFRIIIESRLRDQEGAVMVSHLVGYPPIGFRNYIGSS